MTNYAQKASNRSVSLTNRAYIQPCMKLHLKFRPQHTHQEKIQIEGIRNSMKSNPTDNKVHLSEQIVHFDRSQTGLLNFIFSYIDADLSEGREEFRK